MEAILFALIVAVIAAVGIAIGLAVAPRLGRWDERGNGADAGVDVEGEGETDRD